MISRRGFLKGLAGAAAIAATPGMLEALEPRTIFLPPRGGWPAGKERYAYRVYGSGFVVLEEPGALSEAALHDLHRRYTEALAWSMQLTEERVAANVLNQAFSR